MTLNYKVRNQWPTINDVHLNPQHKPRSTRQASAKLPLHIDSSKLLNIIIPVSTQLGGNNSPKITVAIHNLEPSSCKPAWRNPPSLILYVARLRSNASSQSILMCLHVCWEEWTNIVQKVSINVALSGQPSVDCQSHFQTPACHESTTQFYNCQNQGQSNPPNGRQIYGGLCIKKVDKYNHPIHIGLIVALLQSTVNQ